MDAIEALTLSNTPDVFGLHPNAEIGYYTHSAKDMWGHLVELQPQTGGETGGVSREEFIGKIATDIQGKLPPLFDVDRVRKNISEITPTYVVLLQELDRFNVLIRKMSTSLINLQRVSHGKVLVICPPPPSPYYFRVLVPNIIVNPHPIRVTCVWDKASYVQAFHGDGTPISL